MQKNNTHFRVNGSALLYSLLVLFIPVTLINSRLFISMSFTALFLYLGVISLLTIAYALFVPRTSQPFRFTKPVFIFAIWFVYIVIDGVALHSLHLFHYYLLFSCILLFVLSGIFDTEKKAIRLLITILVISAAAESVICIAQYAGILKSLSSYFRCTGTWENPNITAIFLAMSCPGIYYLWRVAQTGVKKIILINFCLVLAALITLSCRTALIGIVTQFVVIIFYEFDLKQKIKERWKSSVSIAIVVLAVVLLAGLGLYRSKQASADGRILIWKVSAGMFLAHPVSGFGYGGFEQAYNLSQARYFESGAGSTTELRNAGFVHMAYNEFLQNAIEGGIIGLLLLVAIFISLLSVPLSGFKPHTAWDEKSSYNKAHRDENYGYIISYAGLASFAMMSVFNFTLQAIPAMALFIIYSAILCTHPALKRYTIKWQPKQLSYQPAVKVIILIAGLAMALETFAGAYYNLLNKEAKTAVSSGDAVTAIQTLDRIGSNLYTNEDYWINYGNALLAQKQFKNALIKFNQAKSLTSDPALYLKSAQCQVACGDLTGAKNSLLIAAHIEPNHIAPKYDLMKVYLKMNDTLNTVKTGTDIMAIMSKVNSDKAIKYHQATLTLLKRLGMPYQQDEQVSN